MRLTDSMNIAFLASHNGSNMQTIIDACKSGALAATPAVVISNNSDSGAMLRAHQDGIPCYHLSSKTHPAPGDLDQAILEVLQRHQVDLIVLAGYMKKLGPRALARFAGATLNIHPSLLPRHGGQGMYGMYVHTAVLAAGETESGATVHVVDANYDTGAIIAQMRVPVLSDDTPETLATRVLKAEHTLFPQVLQGIVRGQIRLPGFIRQ